MTADRRRVRVTEANLRNHHLYVTKQLRAFFPVDSLGGPRRRSANGHGFDLILDGLDATVRTDIGSDAKNGKARGFLRCRAHGRNSWSQKQEGNALRILTSQACLSWVGSSEFSAMLFHSTYQTAAMKFIWAGGMPTINFLPLTDSRKTSIALECNSDRKSASAALGCFQKRSISSKSTSASNNGPKARHCWTSVFGFLGITHSSSNVQQGPSGLNERCLERFSRSAGSIVRQHM